MGNKKKDKQLDKILKKYEKKMTAKKGSDIEIKPKIRTGVFALDYVLDGGISQDLGGHMIEFFGAESSCKTACALKTIASFQKQGKSCVFINAELSYDPHWAKILGVNNDDIVVLHPDTLEDAGNVLIEMLGKVDLIVIDSIVALVAEAELDKDLQDKTMAAQASVNAAMCRKINKYRNKSGTCIIFINQLREKVGQRFGNPETTSGGRCFDENTRIVTKDGFKYFYEIASGDLIPTINLKTNKIEYKPIYEIYKYDYNGKMYKFHNKYKNEEFLFTPNHKCMVKKFVNGQLNQPEYKIIEAHEKRRTYGMPVCFPSGLEDYPISDNELRLLGWLLTDSSVRINKKVGHSIILYQSIKNHWKRIEQILQKNNIKYAKTKRTRYDKRHCHYNTSYTFRLREAKKIINKYSLVPDKILPDWCFKLSDRQAKILFHEMMLADGTIKNNLYRKICKWSEKWVETLYRFLITHNIPVSKYHKDKNKNCYSLFLRQPDYIGLKSKKVDYKGIVWDISVKDNPLHFIERNGCVIATHNSLKHLYDTRVQFKQKKPIDVGSGENRDRIGFELQMDCRKNKKGKPYHKIVTKFYFDGSFADEENILTQAAKYGIIEQKGAWYYYNDKKYHGVKELKKDIDDYSEIVKEIFERMK